jgi:hypothetical protein
MSAQQRQQQHMERKENERKQYMQSDTKSNHVPTTNPYKQNSPIYSAPTHGSRNTPENINNRYNTVRQLQNRR